MERLSKERVERALARKLGVRDKIGPDVVQAERDFELLRQLLRGDAAKCEQVTRALLQPLEEIIGYALTHSAKDNPNRPRYLKWQKLMEFLHTQGELPKNMINRAVGALAAETAPVKPPPPPLPVAVPREPELPREARHLDWAKLPLPVDIPGEPEPVPSSDSSTPPIAQALPAWKFVPVPDGPDNHEDCDARPFDAPGGLKIIGARVRGKKHKHDGTNCDDWFEFAAAGPWTIIAVSDGAGSKKLSRVGAKAATAAAIRELTAQLANHRLAPRDSHEDWKLPSADVEYVRDALIRTMTTAFLAVKAACDERTSDPAIEAYLGRKPEVNDFSATLLLAVHLPLGDDRDFVMACQIGDGMSAAITRSGSAILLGEADVGGYSGETDFLTSTPKLAADHLGRKIMMFVGPIQAVMVMTDGVADDYFPPEAHMGRLWGDLVVNGIPDIERASDSTPTIDAPEETTEYWDRGQALKANLRSSAALADKLGVPLDALLAQGTLLPATPFDSSVAAAHERLRIWLDAYQVRGSFDDRTLVLLHRPRWS